jgi:hypothetical protein
MRQPEQQTMGSYSQDVEKVRGWIKNEDATLEQLYDLLHISAQSPEAYFVDVMQQAFGLEKR